MYIDLVTVESLLCNPFTVVTLQEQFAAVCN